MLNVTIRDGTEILFPLTSLLEDPQINLSTNVSQCSWRTQTAWK